MLHSLTRAKLALPAPGPFLVPSIILVSFFGSLLPPGNICSVSITAPLIYLISLVMNYPTGNPVNDGLLVIQAAILLTQWIDFHVLHTPEKDFWIAEHFKGVDEGEKVTRVGVEKLGWKAKLGWVVDLKSRARGLGWNWRVKNIPSDPPRRDGIYLPTANSYTI
jgi:hypothetical protein